MPYHASIMYPNEEGVTFDMKYYTDNHCALLKKNFTPLGMKRYEVTEYGPGPDGSKPPYIVQSLLVFDTEEQFQQALGSEGGQALTADIPNFCNKGPTLLTGNVTASG